MSPVPDATPAVARGGASPTRPRPAQLAFDDLDTPLFDTTFVVVDLETTGSSTEHDAITEIGAVKVRGGDVLGEFATLVDPGRAIPPQVVQVTGITAAMVRDAPRIEAVLPGFLEFASGSVLVAHNARFDTGFLKAAAARCEIAWPAFQVLCTVRLARRILARDETPTVRLSALARLLGASTQPTHRALDDARATVDVLHALIERVGNLGVHSLTELVDYLPEVSRRQRSKRFLAADLPAAPGVYLFRGPSEEVLYVGTAVNLRRRVRGYFTGSETRTRMREMVALANRVDHVSCAHGLEAGVRELRLLVAHAPPYNRRSKFPKRAWWLTLTAEPFPRFAVTRTPTWDALGPFGSRADAAGVAATVAEYCGLRTCTARIPRGGRHGADCPPAAVGGCPASADGRLRDAGEYAAAPRAARDLFTGRDDTPLRAIRDRIERHATDEHFEAAAHLRDHLAAIVRALRRTQRLSAVARIAELVAARPDGSGGWEFAVVRYGRLAAAGTAARGIAPMPVVDSLVASAETVLPAKLETKTGRSASGGPGRPPRARGAPPYESRPGPRNRPSGNGIGPDPDLPGLDAAALPTAQSPTGTAAAPADGDVSRSASDTPVPRTENAGQTLDLDSSPDQFADPRYPPLRGASPEETALIARWLEQPGTRIVRTTDGYHEPRLGAGPWLTWLDLAESART